MIKNILSISGGKDSTAMLLLAIERGEDFQCVFADTGHEHEITYQYIEYLETKLGVKIQKVSADFTKDIEGKRGVVETKWRYEGVSEEIIESALAALVPVGNPFLDMCIWKGRFPSSTVRFCTDELKVTPINKQIVMPLIDAGNQVISWQGVRAEESPKRALLPEREELDFGIIAYRPILKWLVADVFDMHKKHAINPNPLYQQGMGRVGCMPCIMCRKGELHEISKRFPEVIDRIRSWEAAVAKASKRQSGTFFGYRETEIIAGTANIGIDEVVEWSKTSRGGKQYGLFTDTEELPSCSSIYGLCEA
jgi:3'-phosphoadenosine 5'-phosphosulfate sulfotransferase (PAPS reductase)/FAD synthetase